MGAFSAQHSVGEHKYLLKRQEISWRDGRLASHTLEVLNESTYLISRFVRLHKVKANFPFYEGGFFFFDSNVSKTYLYAALLLSIL